MISDHSKGFTLMNSLFKHNGVLTGVVVVEVASSFTKGAFIYGSSFTHNTGWSRSSAVYLLTSYHPDSTRSCTGINIQSVNFIQNTQYPGSEAILYLACPDALSTQAQLDGIEDLSFS